MTEIKNRMKIDEVCVKILRSVPVELEKKLKRAATETENMYLATRLVSSVISGFYHMVFRRYGREEAEKWLQNLFKETAQALNCLDRVDLQIVAIFPEKKGKEG